ncbi:MAG: tetratricopeptide repeat protein [Pyrinomonadaceae bacterium]
MGFEKAKVMRAAEKYLAQGKFPAAIKEFQQIVENDRDDYTVANLLGDLYVRTNDKESATACFALVAEHYRAEGFALKAIAMYKKIDRLSPGSVDIAAKLAPLYQLQGLVVDARANYLIVADAYQRAGQAQKALEVLRKIADLDPNNTDIRLKLAEGYLRENFKSEATEAFVEAGTRLQARCQYERAIEAFSRALTVMQGDRAALNGLASTYITMGMPDEAADILERAVAEQPDSAELLSILAQAYIRMGNADSAERATADLIALEPSSYRRYVEVAELYLRAGDLDSTMRVMSTVAEQMLSGNEEAELIKVLNEVLARNPEQLEGLRLLVQVCTWQRDDEQLRMSLERLAEAAELAGEVDEERNAYARLVRLSPINSQYLDRFQELGGSIDDISSLTSPAPSTVEESVPTFESFSGMEGHEFGVPASPESVEYEMLGGENVSVADPSASFADLNDGWNLSAAGTPVEANGAGDAYHEFDLDAPASEVHETPSGDLSAAKKAQLIQELEGVDFYISQGYTDIAVSTLDLLEHQFGSDPGIAERREKVMAMPDATPAPVAAAATNALNPNLSGIDPGLASIFDEFRNAIEEEDEAPDSGDYETHYNLGIAYREMDLIDDAIEEFQAAVSRVAPEDGTARYLQSCNLLGHCFLQKGIPKLAIMWFKKGLQAPGHTEDEYQALRFELATAYEKAGELDQALDLFTEVYGVDVSYRGVADKLKELQQQKSNNG